MLPNWNLLVWYLKRLSKQAHLTRWLKELVANWAAGRKGLAPLPLAPVALHHHGGCRVPFSTMVAPTTLLWCPTLPFPTALGGCHHQLLVLVKGRNRGPKSTQLPPSRFIWFLAAQHCTLGFFGRLGTKASHLGIWSHTSLRIWSVTGQPSPTHFPP